MLVGVQNISKRTQTARLEEKNVTCVHMLVTSNAVVQQNYNRLNRIRGKKTVGEGAANRSDFVKGGTHAFGINQKQHDEKVLTNIGGVDIRVTIDLGATLNVADSIMGRFKT